MTATQDPGVYYDPWTDWEVDYDNAVLDHTSTTRGWMSLPVVTS